MGARSLSHWTTKEVPKNTSYLTPSVPGLRWEKGFPSPVGQGCPESSTYIEASGFASPGRGLGTRASGECTVSDRLPGLCVSGSHPRREDLFGHFPGWVQLRAVLAGRGGCGLGLTTRARSHHCCSSLGGLGKLLPPQLASWPVKWGYFHRGRGRQGRVQGWPTGGVSSSPGVQA